MNQMIQQKPFRGFRCIRIQLPGTFTLPNRIPRPDGIRIQCMHHNHLDFNPTMMRGDPNPIAITELVLFCNFR